MTHSQAPAPVCRVLQFTDSHLLADPEKVFLGIRPLETFDAVIKLTYEKSKTDALSILCNRLSALIKVALY